MKKRIEQIDIARGFAAICMILGHSFIVYPIDISQVGWCRVLHEWIYSFHMELFFFLAGAVWYCKDYKTYIFKKCKRILIPYIAFGLLSIVLRMMGTSLVNNNASLKDGIINFIFGGGGYWFLYVLFIIFLVFPLIDSLMIKMRIPDERLLIGAAVLMLIASTVKLPTIFMIDSLVYHLPFFMVGKYTIGIRELLRKEVKTPAVGFTALISLAVYIALVFILQAYGIVALTQIRAFSMIILVICLVEMGVRIKNSNSSKGFDRIIKAVDECGQYTLQLYLFNGYILVVIRTILVSYLKVHNPLIIVLVVTLGNLFITVFLCKRVIRRIPFIRTLCGL